MIKKRSAKTHTPSGTQATVGASLSSPSLSDQLQTMIKVDANSWVGYYATSCNSTSRAVAVPTTWYTDPVEATADTQDVTQHTGIRAMSWMGAFTDPDGNLCVIYTPTATKKQVEDGIQRKPAETEALKHPLSIGIPTDNDNDAMLKTHLMEKGTGKGPKGDACGINVHMTPDGTLYSDLTQLHLVSTTGVSLRKPEELTAQGHATHNLACGPVMCPITHVLAPEGIKEALEGTHPIHRNGAGNWTMPDKTAVIPDSPLVKQPMTPDLQATLMDYLAPGVPGHVEIHLEDGSTQSFPVRSYVTSKIEAGYMQFHLQFDGALPAGAVIKDAHFGLSPKGSSYGMCDTIFTGNMEYNPKTNTYVFTTSTIHADKSICTEDGRIRGDIRREPDSQAIVAIPRSKVPKTPEETTERFGCLGLTTQALSHLSFLSEKDHEALLDSRLDSIKEGFDFGKAVTELSAILKECSGIQGNKEHIDATVKELENAATRSDKKEIKAKALDLLIHAVPLLANSNPGGNQATARLLIAKILLNNYELPKQ